MSPERKNAKLPGYRRCPKAFEAAVERLIWVREGLRIFEAAKHCGSMEKEWYNFSGDGWCCKVFVGAVVPAGSGFGKV